jgi:hypothetical protein
MELLLLSIRARLRRGWLRSLAIVMLIGVVGGFVIAAAATARRVDVAYQALLSEIDAPDLLVFPECGSSAITGCTGPPVEPGIDIAQLTGDEAVERVRPIGWVRPYLIAVDGSPLLATADNPIGCFICATPPGASPPARIWRLRWPSRDPENSATWRPASPPWSTRSPRLALSNSD